MDELDRMINQGANSIPTSQAAARQASQAAMRADRIGKQAITPRQMLVVLTIVACSAIDAPAAGFDDENDQPLAALQSLADMWDGERTAVTNAHFRLQIIRSMGRYLKPLRREEVNQILSRLDLVANPQDMKVLYDEIFVTTSTTAEPWAVTELFLEGGKSREVHRQSLDDGEFVISENAYNGGQQVMSKATPGHAQATIVSGDSGLYRLRLHDLRMVPNIPPEDFEKYLLTRHPDNTVTIKQGANELVADLGTGMVLRFTVSSNNGAHVSETFQYGSIHCAGGGIFPVVSVRLSYRDNNLSSLTAIRVQQATTNSELPKGALSVAGKAGMVLVDETSSARRIDVLSAPVPDVTMPAPPLAENTGIRGRTVIVVMSWTAICLLIVGLVYWLWRRTRIAT